MTSYEFVMNFKSIGQTVKGHSDNLIDKSKGKTEQSRKVRAKPMGWLRLRAKNAFVPNI